jgi:K+ transporter
LFAVQRRGTESIGRLFGPVTVVWFTVIGLLGLLNIWVSPDILRALSPIEAARFVVANPVIGFAVIGTVFLALTGGKRFTPTWATSALRHPRGLVRPHADRRPRVPFGERHSVERLGHGFYRIQVRLGFIQTPDIPRTLQNCQMLGFTADLDHAHYYIAMRRWCGVPRTRRWGRSRSRSSRS